MKFVHIADMHFDSPFVKLSDKDILGDLRRLEQRKVFKKIIEYIKNNNIKYIKNIEKELKKAEEKIDIELSEKQKEAIKQVNENNVTIITGGPGTGKTTIIKTIIDIYEQRKNKVVLCAPTRTSCKKNDRNNRKRSLNIT